MRKLIYVSNNALLLGGEINPFLEQEKEWLLDEFGPFYVICAMGLFEINNDGMKAIYSTNNKIQSVKYALSSILESHFRIEVFSLIRDSQFTLKNFIRMIDFYSKGRLMEDCIYRAIKLLRNDDITLYSYWLSYDAYACARVKSRNEKIIAISRAHSYEIQINRNICNPYLMKKYICKYLDSVYFISYDSYNSFVDYYGKNDKFHVLYLGSTLRNTGLVERSSNNRLTILSCSAIVSVKRLDRIINALSEIDEIKITWIHIGDGPEKERIMKMAHDELKGMNIEFEFMGKLKNVQVHNIMKRKDVNVFVNSSESEGIPVSIMEAMSVGLPVIAPEICGIPELVDSECGILYNKKNGGISLKDALLMFYYLDNKTKYEMGRKAYSKWKSRFCLEKNIGELFGIKNN